ncbi:MAG TPA: ArsA family ATPase [Candidatus Thermoplasmatota archaeon]|nr:ArsA family ATPase [Candidatus Thermoplasmatota archaeon]
MEGLLAKRLVIVAGKGGVGKTTASSAIALHLAKAGRRTLLVTVDPAKRLEDSLGVPVGFQETPIQPNLAAMMLDPEAVLREHLAREIPQVRVTEHPLFRYVTQHLPGLNELMAIGKLNDLRRAGRFDAIVVDTAPTGHALSFLSAPKAIEELMSERSLLKWAVRGYAVWQKVSSTARSAQNLFRRKEEREEAPPDLDLEKVFAGIQSEAKRIRAFLTDPENTALVLVTLPEKLPVEETCDLHKAVTEGLGMRVFAIVANKVQPDALRGVQGRFDALARDAASRSRFTSGAARATGESPELVEALLAATEFAEVRRAMNLGYLKEIQARLPGLPVVAVPLFKLDVQGLARLGEFRAALFDAGNRVA